MPMHPAPKPMTVFRIRESDPIRPFQVALICLVAVVMAGGMLLLSAARPTAPVDGAIEWHEGSWLHAVVEFLCLNYQVATFYAGDIKNYILGVGTGLALLALCLAIMLRPRTSDECINEGDTHLANGDFNGVSGGRVAEKAHMAPLVAAQTLVLLYVLWSFASSRWSRASELAIGGSILLAVQFLWAFVLGAGLKTRSAAVAARAMFVVLAITAVTAVWYHHGRNPTLRADFPVGNPVFLATCLIPVILLGVAWLVGGGWRGRPAQRVSRLIKTGLIAAVVGVSLWAFWLCDSRGAWVGLLFGILGLAFFGLRRRQKFIPLAVAVVVVAGGIWYAASRSDAVSAENRSETFRLRLYAWDYALRMFAEEPFRGFGQGAFAVQGDSYAVDDVLDDPRALSKRLAHAHNEWLEVMADLGSVGLVLILGALGLTLRAGIGAIAHVEGAKSKWTLIAILGSLVGLTVAACFDVGLRVSGVPTVFYTLLGLSWALSGVAQVGAVERVSASRSLRLPFAIVAGLLGVLALAVTQQDFNAARNLHRAEEAFRRGDHEAAIQYATEATDRLNPQRALTNLYRLSEAHLIAAESIQGRGMDRQRRAYEVDPPRDRFLALATEDFLRSDAHCERGSEALKELLLRSPGFINHGRLGFRLNLTRAGNAGARGDTQRQQAFIQEAAAALKREMQRQPFDPELAADYVRVTGTTLEPSSLAAYLARPLRHHRVIASYLNVVRALIVDPNFDAKFEPVWQEARSALRQAVVDEQTGQPVETWAPEHLRLAATAYFLMGRYQEAAKHLAGAAEAYRDLAAHAPIGAASCSAELAICQFFQNPTQPDRAIQAARRAIELAPSSYEGRKIVSGVKSRMVEYYLAAGLEEDAAKLLRENAPIHATPQDVQRELGARYRRLCERLLGRPQAGNGSPSPPTDLLERMLTWIARGLELFDADPVAHYVAAVLSFDDGNDETSAAYLQDALQRGLPVEEVIRFLNSASQRRPLGEPLSELLRIINAGPEGPRTDEGGTLAP